MGCFLQHLSDFSQVWASYGEKIWPHWLQPTQNIMRRANAFVDLKPLLGATDGLFDGDFAAYDNALKLSLVEKAAKAARMHRELLRPASVGIDSDDVLENPHEAWPKEHDFAEMKSFVAKAARDGISTSLAKSWLSVLADFERLYHLRNLEAHLSLEKWLTEWAAAGGTSRHRAAVLERSAAGQRHRQPEKVRVVMR